VKVELPGVQSVILSSTFHRTQNRSLLSMTLVKLSQHNTSKVASINGNILQCKINVENEARFDHPVQLEINQAYWY